MDMKIQCLLMQGLYETARHLDVDVKEWKVMNKICSVWGVLVDNPESTGNLHYEW
jgi:hypothetical protein